MKKYALALLLLCASPAWADTITVQLSGSSLTGLTGTPSVSYTLSDTDLQNLINWATQHFAPCLQQNYNTGPLSNPVTAATNGQVLACWLGVQLYNQTLLGVQNFMTTAPVIPPTIGLTPGTGAAGH